MNADEIVFLKTIEGKKMRNLLQENGNVKQCIAFDIETVMSDNTDMYIDKFKTFKAPSNYKSKDAIENYIENAKGKERAKAALYIPTQRVWVICAEVVKTRDKVSFSDTDERKVIRHFFEFLESYEDHVLFGFNSRGFDFPALYAASCRNEIGVPPQLRSTSLMSDVLDDFYHVKVKLQDIAFLMGKEKTMSGADVGQAYLSYIIDGNVSALESVIEYCHCDVDICAEYVRRAYFTLEDKIPF